MFTSKTTDLQHGHTQRARLGVPGLVGSHHVRAVVPLGNIFDTLDGWDPVVKVVVAHVCFRVSRSDCVDM
jgi:hypothetical protein